MKNTSGKRGAKHTELGSEEEQEPREGLAETSYQRKIPCFLLSACVHSVKSLDDMSQVDFLSSFSSGLDAKLKPFLVFPG